MRLRTRAQHQTLTQSRNRAALVAARRAAWAREVYDARWFFVVGVALSVAFGLGGLFR